MLGCTAWSTMGTACQTYHVNTAVQRYKVQRIAEFCSVLSRYCPPPWESEAPISKIRRQNMQQNMHEMHWKWTTGFGNESDPIQETSNRSLANKVFAQVHGSAWACSILSHYPISVGFPTDLMPLLHILLHWGCVPGGIVELFQML